MRRMFVESPAALIPKKSKDLTNKADTCFVGPSLSFPLHNLVPEQGCHVVEQVSARYVDLTLGGCQRVERSVRYPLVYRGVRLES